MGNAKNLQYQEALEKIKEIAEGNICLFGTYENERIVTRPMSTNKVDDEGQLWFISSRQSMKNAQLETNPHVSLQYMNDGKSEYLSLSGRAKIVEDREKIKELWNPIAKAWFPEGSDDPNITLICVLPEDGHYWDTKHGKLVSMLKIAVAAVSGNQMDDAVEGDLNL